MKSKLPELYSLKTSYIKRVLRYNFSNCKLVRKYIGGYWENWIIEILHGDCWIQVEKSQAYDPYYRPGCGVGTPECEYYPINFYGMKNEFDNNRKNQIKRELKFKRILQ